MVEKTLPSNTSDWSKDMRPDIERLFGLDGDGSSLSEEDVLLSWPAFCDNNYSGSEVKDIVCSYDRTPGSLWRIAGEINNLRSKFSQDNPLNEHARMEEKLLSAETINGGRIFLEEILLKVKDELARHPGLSPQEKVKLVYKVMRDVGITLHEQKNLLFFENLADKGVDCDTSSFIVMAVAHELGWPLHLVGATGHLFVRWQGEKEAFNVDYGIIRPDEYYTKYSIDQDGLLEGTSYFSIVHFNLGFVLDNLGRYEEAEAEYREAIGLDPKNATAHSGLGRLLADLGRYEEAEAEFRKSIALNPKNAKDHDNLGLLLRKLGRYEEAEAEYREAISLDPKDVFARYNLSLLYYHHLDKWEAALSCAEEAYRLNPDNVKYKEWRDKLDSEAHSFWSNIFTP